METVADCIFCKIVAGEIPADIVATSTGAIAFRDINPKAPVHCLVIPTEHYENVAELAAADPEVLAELVGLAEGVAMMAADTPGGESFRLIFNNGAEAGQAVFHVHGHVLAGEKLGWNPA
ncbi:MAG: HIT domain-containing protein [Cellulomonadaceae bacterium]|jgi:histidine triad (HIT) family protein|nr:HIT domain-containing protein [Cellulomonadaceae bacterium]